MKKLLLIALLVTTINAGLMEDNIKECNAGNASICDLVGFTYKIGNGVKQSSVKSAHYFKKACFGGIPSACNALGIQYKYGLGVKQSYSKSRDVLEKACKKKYSEACFTLATFYDDGEGVKQNYKKAIDYYRKSCYGGYNVACLNLSLMYINGNGVKKNYKTAINMVTKVAKDGNPNAQWLLGNMYMDGLGTDKNYIQSYAWINLSIKNGLDKGKSDLTKLKLKMTIQQIQIAQNYNPVNQGTPPKPRLKPQQEPKIPVAKTKEPIIYTGTGFFVSASTILTNNHVAKGCKKLDIVRKGYRSGATLIANDVNNDLALLKTDQPNNSFLKFKTGKGIRLGKDILVLGYPLGDLLGSSLKLTTGNISSLTGLSDDTTRLQISAPVQPGNSGGPLLDKSGNVVGVVYAKLAKRFSAENVNLAIKANVAQMFLDINHVNYEMSASGSTKDVADIADEAMNSVVQVVCTQ